MKISGFDTLRKAFKDVSEGIMAVKDFATEHGQRIAAALGSHSDFSPLARNYHRLKAVAALGLLFVSAVTLQPEAMLGTGFMTADEVATLDQVGKHTLEHLSHAPKSHIF